MDFLLPFPVTFCFVCFSPGFAGFFSLDDDLESFWTTGRAGTATFGLDFMDGSDVWGLGVEAEDVEDTTLLYKRTINVVNE